MLKILLVLALLLAACGGDDKPSALAPVPTKVASIVNAATGTLSVGQSGELMPGLKLTILGLTKGKCPINQALSDSYFPDADKEMLVIDAQLENGTAQFARSAFGLTVKSPENQQIDTRRYLGRGFDSLKQGVPPNDKHRDFLCAPLTDYVGTAPSSFSGWIIQATDGVRLTPLTWRLS